MYKGAGTRRGFASFSKRLNRSPARLGYGGVTLFGGFSFLFSQREIVIDHQPYELIESHFRLPIQFTPSSACISQQQIYFGGPKVTRIDLHVSLPVKIEISKRLFN